MEMKKIVECIRRCEKITSVDDCVGCDYIFYGLLDCYHVLKKDAAKRLEELDAELEKRAIDDRPYEWISVEERLPEEKQELFMCLKEREFFLVLRGFYANSEWYVYTGVNLYTQCDDIPSFWVPDSIIEPPKPKEPTFKDVFLEKFPKAPVDENGIPELCVRAVFPQMGSIKPHERSCGWAHDKCWNQPYFEEEEKE